MWIFLTTVFLVLFFLFYRHPKIMLKTTGAVLGALVFIGYSLYYWNQIRSSVIPSAA
jgi:O-antigen/teichoic acid export membrane protein